MKGGYVLILQLPHAQPLTIKSLGDFVLTKGTWLYVGSAMGSGPTSLEGRIRRHFREQKTVHWHIDFLLSQTAHLKAAVFVESPHAVECEIAQSLQKNKEYKPGPRGFGASDCTNHCVSHIFHCLRKESPQEMLMQILSELGFEPRITFDGSILSLS